MACPFRWFGSSSSRPFRSPLSPERPANWCSVFAGLNPETAKVNARANTIEAAPISRMADHSLSSAGGRSECASRGFEPPLCSSPGRRGREDRDVTLRHLNASNAPCVGPARKASVEEPPFVLKACGFILNRRGGCPEAAQPGWRPIPRDGFLARSVQFDKADKGESVAGLSNERGLRMNPLLAG